MLDDELLLSIFSEKKRIAMDLFREFNQASNEEQCLEDEQTTKRLTDEQARAEINNMIPLNKIAKIKSLPKAERDEIIFKVKGIEGLSHRQAARILGISPNLIFKA